MSVFGVCNFKLFDKLQSNSRKNSHDSILIKISVENYTEIFLTK